MAGTRLKIQKIFLIQLTTLVLTALVANYVVHYRKLSSINYSKKDKNRIVLTCVFQNHIHMSNTCDNLSKNLNNNKQLIGMTKDIVANVKIVGNYFEKKNYQDYFSNNLGLLDTEIIISHKETTSAGRKDKILKIIELGNGRFGGFMEYDDTSTKQQLDSSLLNLIYDLHNNYSVKSTLSLQYESLDYLPYDYLMGIFLPLLLPLSVPMFVGYMKELKRYNKKKSNC